MKKLRIGWFSFSCCEDSTIIFTELLNEHFAQWRKLLDIRAMLVLQKKEDMTSLDVAFVEGAVTSRDQSDKLKLSEVVPIDDQVPGCPMNEKIFLNILDKYLKEFKIDA